VHGLPLKLPGSLEPKLAVPVGVLAVPPSLSVTVAVHSEVSPRSTLVGEQLTLVDVERVVTLKPVKPRVLTLLPACLESPGYRAKIVCATVSMALGV